MSSPQFVTRQLVTRMMIAAIAFALCGGPELLQAQQSQSDGLTTLASTTPQQQQETTAAPATTDQANPQPAAQQAQDQNLGTTQQNATPDPSKGPLQPAETNAPPDAPTPAPAAQQTREQQPAQAPAGTAAAQGVKTAGGAASRPAGTAIAPAKQHQTRSLLIKFGAIAAGAVALGTVYGLSRSSSSTPHTTATGAVR